MRDEKFANRRNVIKATGVGLSAGIAGCSGLGTSSESGSQKDGLVVGTAGSSTSIYAMTQGMSAIMDEYSDVSFEARSTEGSYATAGQMEDGTFNAGILSNDMASLMNEGTGELGDLTFEPRLVMHAYDLSWFVASPKEYTSVSDIQSDDRVSLSPAATSTRDYLHHALEYEVEEYEGIDVAYGSQASTMSEGRQDVGGGLLINYENPAGWTEEMISLNELSLLDWPDDTLAELEEDPRVIMQSIDTNLSDFGFAYAPDEPIAPALVWWYIAHAGQNYDLIYNWLDTIWSQREELAGYHANLELFAENDEWWIDGELDIDYHEAARDFYEEKGLL